MITRGKLPELLTSITGFSASNVAYRSFPIGEAPALPFIAYFYEEEPQFYADGVNYYGSTHIAIELYTKLKNPGLESEIETVLTANKITYSKEGDYLHDDKDYLTVYEITLQNEDI